MNTVPALPAALVVLLALAAGSLGAAGLYFGWRPKSRNGTTWYVAAYWHEHGQSIGRLLATARLEVTPTACLGTRTPRR